MAWVEEKPRSGLSGHSSAKVLLGTLGQSQGPIAPGVGEEGNFVSLNFRSLQALCGVYWVKSLDVCTGDILIDFLNSGVCLFSSIGRFVKLLFILVSTNFSIWCHQEPLHLTNPFVVEAPV